MYLNEIENVWESECYTADNSLMLKIDYILWNSCWFY